MLCPRLSGDVTTTVVSVPSDWSSNASADRTTSTSTPSSASTCASARAPRAPGFSGSWSAPVRGPPREDDGDEQGREGPQPDHEQRTVASEPVAHRTPASSSSRARTNAACSRVASRSPYSTRSKSRAPSRHACRLVGVRRPQRLRHLVGRGAGCRVQAPALDLAGGERAEGVDQGIGGTPLGQLSLRPLTPLRRADGGVREDGVVAGPPLGRGAGARREPDQGEHEQQPDRHRGEGRERGSVRGGVEDVQHPAAQPVQQPLHHVVLVVGGVEQLAAQQVTPLLRRRNEGRIGQWPPPHERVSPCPLHQHHVERLGAHPQVDVLQGRHRGGERRHERGGDHRRDGLPDDEQEHARLAGHAAEEQPLAHEADRHGQHRAGDLGDDEGEQRDAEGPPEGPAGEVVAATRGRRTPRSARASARARAGSRSRTQNHRKNAMNSGTLTRP